MADRQWKRSKIGLTTEVGSGVSALDWADGEGGGEGGGGGDGGGGDPVEQEPSVPWVVNGRCIALFLRRFQFKRSHVRSHLDGPLLPAGAGGQGGEGEVADGGRLQGRRRRRCAHEEQLWLPHNIVFRSEEEETLDFFFLRNWIRTYAATAMSTERRTADFMLKAERLTEMLEENDRSP